MERLVKVFGYIKDPFLNPIPAAPVFIQINPKPQNTIISILDKTRYTRLSNEEGYFEVLLAGGVSVTITIPAAQFQVTGLLPSTGEINVLNIERQP